MFTDPDDINNFNAFVAINEQDKLIGVIGYSLSVYTDGYHDISGVIPMSWKIADDYKGFAGIQLFKKVLALGEFGMAIGGSETAKKLYPLFKYEFLSNSIEYYKLLHLANALLSLKRRTPFKTVGMVGYLLPTYFKSTNTKPLTKEIKLVPYNGDDFKDEPIYKGIFRKKISKEYTNWLLSCPKLKASAFKIYHREEYLGNCVLYIQRVNNFNRGRIVHLPFLGFDRDLWAAVIEHCFQFFRSEQCCLVSGLAHNPINQAAFLSSGFMKLRKAMKPVFIKDIKSNLAGFDLTKWYLQYSEGDKAYRDL